MRKRLSVILVLLLLICATVSLAVSADEAYESAVTGASLWLRADQGVETDAGGVVTRWKDQSGNGRDGVAYETYGMPKLVESSINGKPGILFEGGTQVVDIPVPLEENWGQEFSVFFVYEPAAIPSAVNTGKHFIGTDDWRMFNLHTYNPNGGLFVGNGSTYNGADYNVRIVDTDNAGTYAAGEPVLIQFTQQNGVGTLWKNGVQVASKPMPAPMTWDKFRLGLPGTNCGLDGALCELIVFDQELTVTQQSSVTRYLYDKYFAEVESAQISLDRAEAELASGDTLTLTASATPAGSQVAWTSSNESVATVSASGVVTAVGPGTAEIRATVKDAFISAGCTVTVRAKTLNESMVLWLDAARVETNASGVLTRWPDQSGSGNHGVAASGASLPTQVEKGIGSLPVVRFATEGGVKDAVDVPTLTGDMNSYSLYLVFKPGSLSGENYQLIRAKGEWKQFIMHSYENGGKFYAGINVNQRFVIDGIYETDVWTIVEFRNNNGVCDLYQDGVKLGTVTTASAEAWTGFDMGVVGQMSGDMAELRIYERALTDEERVQVYQELNNKYFKQKAETMYYPALWLDAAEVETDANGTLTKWPDQSGGENHGVAYSGKALPTLVENAVNGKPAIRFETESGVKDAVDIPTLSGDRKSFSVYMVYKPASLAVGVNHVIRAKEDWGTFVMHTYGSGTLYIGTDQTNRFEASNYFTAEEWTLLEFRSENGTNSLYRNGTLIGTKTGAASGAWSGFELGVADEMRGDLAELLIYDRALTDAERQAVSDTLLEKYFNQATKDMESPVLWLDAAKVNTDANGVLTGWPDQSGNGHNGIAYGGTSMPKLVENVINGHPVVRFETENGSKDAVDIPTLTGEMENFSVYFVYRPASIEKPYNHVVRAKGEWDEFIMHTYHQQSGDGSVYIGSDLQQRFSNTNEGLDYYHAGVWNILEYRAQGSVTSLYQNGVLLATMDTGVTGDPWTGFDMGVVDQMYGDVAELLIYNYALTDAQRSKISQHLQMKYYGTIAPEEMTITSSNGTRLDKDTPTTQLAVTVTPEAAGTDVSWRVTDSGGEESTIASVTEEGLLTVTGSGTVWAVATHKATGVTADLKITADIQKTYEVRGIKTISTAEGTTRLSVWEDGVELTGVVWTLYGEDMKPTDLAQMDQDGVITAAKNGTVIAVAEKDGQTWAANVTISGQAASGTAVDAVYVSETGSDSNPGTFEFPKKTIAAGLATGADYVYVLSGNYDLTQTLRPASGQTLAGYPMGTALVTGGCRVPEDTVWTQVEGKPYYVASVTVSNAFRELYVNGEAANLAESQSYTASWYVEGGVNRGYIISGLNLPADTDSNIEMHWNHRFWRCNRLVVDEVRQTNGGVILLPEFDSFQWATICDFAAAGPQASESFTLMNDLAFLDEPGEWFYDEDTDQLYYYPEPGERIDKLEFYIPQIDTLVEISGSDVNNKIRNVTIDNLHFAYTTWQRAVVHGSAAVQADFVSNDIGNGSHTDAGELPAAVIHSEFARNITIRNCEIRNTGANAIILENAVNDSVIENNLIEDTAFSAITVSRPQNSFLDQENEEVPKDILIFNNRIDNAAWKYHSGSGVCGYYTDGLTVDHNHISHTAWAGMTFGWNGWQATEKDSITHRNLTVTHNYVYSFAEVSRDSGGIYTLGQCPNALIAYNHLEKLVRDYAGIYNDEGSGYFYVGHNVMDDVNGSVVNWWTSTIHDMYAEGNYHNVGGTNNKATRGYIVGTQQYASGNRPAEAQAIVDNAGLTDQPYQSLRSFTAGNLAAGKNVTFVQPNGAADYGTVGHMPQFAANGLPVYAEASAAGSAMVVDLLAYYDVTGASLALVAGDSLPTYTVEVSADNIDWTPWDAASKAAHVRYVRFVPANDGILQVQEVIVTGTKESSFTGKADKNLTLPQSANLTVQLQAESAVMIADHLTTWVNDAGGSAARIPDSHSQGLDPQAVANSGYSKKPIVMEGIITGRPMVRFDGFDDAMQVDNVEGTAASMTLMLYVRPTDAAHFKFSSDGFALQMVNGAYSLTIGATTLTASQPAVLNTWQLLILTVSDGTATLTVDGETVLEGAVSGGSSHNTLYLGDNVGIRHKNYGTALGVDLAEVALYRTALSAADRSELSELVMKKYSNVIVVTGVSLDRTVAELILREEGRNTIQLTAAVEPEDATNREVIWSSENDSVAKVTNGLVTAVSKGVTTITVTTVNGGISASCQITVVDPVGDVESKINEISTVTLESLADIVDAEVAYAALTDAQKALVTNHEDLTAARETYEALKAAADKLAADKAAAAGVDAKIGEIGEVTLDSKAAIEAARNAYTALKDDQEQWVTKLAELEAAEARLADLQAAKAVDTLIDLIGEVTLEDKAAIEAAEKAYDELTEARQAEVKHYAKLLAARDEYNRLKAAADKLAADKKAAAGVDRLIDTIGEVTLQSKDLIEAVRAAYEALTDDEKAHVTKLDVLEAAEAEYAKQKAQRDLLIQMIIAGASNPKMPFTDVTRADWFYDEVNGAWQAGLINGITETTYEPNSSLTVAQAIKLAAALHQRNEKGRVTLKNGDTAWYSSYVEYAVRNKIIGAEYLTYSDGKMNSAVSRAEFVHILHGAMTYYKWVNNVADNAIPDVKTGSAYAAEIYEFYRAGILTGSDAAGTFYPASSIKRSEVAAILVRMFDTSARQSVTLN